MSGPSPSTVFNLLKSQLFFHPPPVTSSFEGQTVLVTGGNAGLGRETVRLLLGLSAEKVIIACRNVEKGEAAKRELLSEAAAGETRIEIMQLDMASYASVLAFGEQVKTIPRLDAVIENAGMWPNKQAVAEGHEETITTNVITTCLLAYLLLPKLQETATNFSTTTRLCFISSRLHKFATLKARNDSKHKSIFAALDAQQLKTGADYDMRYNDTKLLLLLYVQRLAQLYQQQHPQGVCITVINPGYCATSLKPPTDLSTKLFERMLARTSEEGARVYVDAIALDKVGGRHGKYLDDYKPDAPAPWIGSRDGQHTSDRVWTDLNTILDGIVPGTTASL